MNKSEELINICEGEKYGDIITFKDDEEAIRHLRDSIKKKPHLKKSTHFSLGSKMSNGKYSLHSASGKMRTRKKLEPGHFTKLDGKVIKLWTNQKNWLNYVNPNSKLIWIILERVQNLGIIKKRRSSFFHHSPEEISWDELKEINFKMWDFLIDIANELIADGALNQGNIPKNLVGRRISK